MIPLPFLWIFGTVLAVSLAGNAFMFHLYTGTLEEKGQAESAVAQWQATANTCTDSVDKLARDGEKRQKELLNRITTESSRIKGLQHDALTALSAKPENPQDLCGSLVKYLQGDIRNE